MNTKFFFSQSIIFKEPVSASLKSSFVCCHNDFPYIMAVTTTTTFRINNIEMESNETGGTRQCLWKVFTSKYTLTVCTSWTSSKCL